MLHGSAAMNNVFLFIYRMRGVMFAAAVIVLVGFAVFGSLIPSSWGALRGVLSTGAFSVLVLVVLLALVGPRFLPQREPLVVHAPVQGRWMALNSPVSKVPSPTGKRTQLTSCTSRLNQRVHNLVLGQRCATRQHTPHSVNPYTR